MDQGDITRKQGQAEWSFLCMTLRTDLFYNSTKYHSNISKGFRSYAPETKVKQKYGSGDITRKRRQAELSFLCMTLHTDLFYKPTKYHSNIPNGFGVMLRKPK